MLSAAAAQLCDMIRAFVWGPPMLLLLLGTGVYFTAATRLFQLRHLGLWLRRTLLSCLTGSARRQGRAGGVSPFATMCTALAAAAGTGNIAGVATALTIGGPGAVFWMWVSAFFGMMTAFAENVLGMLYRTRGRDGAWQGGPMLYLKKGLHSPGLAGAFALCCMLASFGVGNLSQCNSVADGMAAVFGVSPQATGLVMAALAAAVLLGGLGRISRVAETLVPLLSLFYMAGAAAALWCGRAQLAQACGEIFACAFDWRAGAGGAAGYGMAQAIRVGVSRGVFSNEAGMGSSVMVHAAADAKEPCEQGMWAVFEVFADTIVMCTATALVILSSGAYCGAAGPTGTPLTAAAFSAALGPWGGAFVAVSLALFAFSSLLGWAYYGQRAAAYLCPRAVPLYKAAYAAAAWAGCVMRLDLVWALSDVFNGLMALPNLIGVLALRRAVLAEWQRYRRANHIGQFRPLSRRHVTQFAQKSPSSR